MQRVEKLKDLILEPNKDFEYFTVTNYLRYKKDFITQQPMLQQMYQGSNGSQEWRWVEMVD